MKRFLLSFLGSLAAIWFSAILLFVGCIVLMIAGIAGAASGDSASVRIDKRSVLYIDLTADISDRPAPVDIFAKLQGVNDESLPLNNLVDALRAAADDDRIAGAFINCGGGAAGTAQIQEIIDALNYFKQKKWVWAYADNFSQSNYIIASHATRVFLNPAGGVDLHGLGATTLYFKDLLDNIGVEAQVVKVGTYKSAVEPFILDSISAPAREQQLAYLGSIWHSLASSVASARSLKLDRVNQLADSLLMFRPADECLRLKLVDEIKYKREVIDLLEAEVDHDEVPFVTPVDYCAAVNTDKEIYGGGDTRIAVLYAVGDITESGKDGITSDKLVPQILDLADDDDIDGLILRVNSGGGSAYASEQIWEAIAHFKDKTGKPVYASMGDVAASGGYYILCGADRIYADSATITGSIGIFGIIPNAQKLLNNKLGVNTSTVATNPTGLPPTLFEPMTPHQRASMQAYVDRGYDLFTRRVAQGRHMSQDSVKAIAEGRVWDGLTARRIGLVDQLGGLEQTIRAMADELGASSFSVVEYPAIKYKWWEELMAMDDSMSARVLDRLPDPWRQMYRSVGDISSMSTLQCRMDYIIIR